MNQNTKAGELIVSKLILFLILLAVVLCGYYLSVRSGVFTEEQLRAHLSELVVFRNKHPVYVSLLFCATFVVIAGLGMPVAGMLLIAGGGVFGYLWGLALGIFSTSAAAMLAFWLSRYLFSDCVRHRFAPQLDTIWHGVQRDAGFYLFSIRVLQIPPFFLVNLVMGVSPMPAWTYFRASVLGLIPGCAIWVNVGSQLAKVEDLRDVYTPEILVSLALLALFPWVARVAIEWATDYRRRH